MVGKKDRGILLESGTNELEIIEFVVADGHFGINVAKVHEILKCSTYPITPMPNANPFIEGVFKPREDIMTVINLAAYMGLPPSNDEEGDILIVTKFNNVKTAFHVHDVKQIATISWTNIEKPDKTIYGGEEGLATGIANYDGRLITIIDFEKILVDISPSAGIMVSDIDRLGERQKTDKPVLVAEDSPLLERMIIESLERAGYVNVTCCSNGKETWDKLAEFKKTGRPIEEFACILITDIEMPQMDGHRLMRLIRADEYMAQLPIIVFSSLITDEMRIKGERLGATAQITKPEIVNLVTLIDQHIL